MITAITTIANADSIVSIDVWACQGNIIFTLYGNYNLAIRKEGKEKERINVVEFNRILKNEKEGKNIKIKSDGKSGRIKMGKLDIVIVGQWDEFKQVIEDCCSFLKGGKT